MSRLCGVGSPERKLFQAQSSLLVARSLFHPNRQRKPFSTPKVSAEGGDAKTAGWLILRFLHLCAPKGDCPPAGGSYFRGIGLFAPGTVPF